MKGRANKILLCVGVLAGVLSVVDILLCFSNGVISLPLPNVSYDLMFILPPLAFFAIELLLCRAVKSWWVKLIPLALATAALIFSVVKMLTGVDWEIFGWLVIACLCAGPFVACIAALAAYGIMRAMAKRRQRKAAENAENNG